MTGLSTDDIERVRNSFDRMSYALVMKATKPIYVGDVVQTP